jgi:hypothetical protein
LSDWNTELERANGEIAELHVRISFQREIVKQLAAAGADTTLAQRVLEIRKERLAGAGPPEIYRVPDRERRRGRVAAAAGERSVLRAPALSLGPDVERFRPAAGPRSMQPRFTGA